MTKIYAKLQVTADAKYQITKPDNWSDMTTEEKVEYFLDKCCLTENPFSNVHCEDGGGLWRRPEFFEEATLKLSGGRSVRVGVLWEEG